MDISRPELAAKRKRRRILIMGTALVLIGALAFFVSQLDPAVPTVDSSTIWLDTVEQGEMLRQVRGNGTLIPENILVVPTEVGGRVVRIDVLPGATVEPDTMILELSNPPLKQQAFELKHQLKGAEARLAQLQVQLKEARLALESKVAELESQRNLAMLEAEADRTLAEDGLVPELTMKTSQARANDLRRQLELEKKRVTTASESAEAQVAVERSMITKLEAALELKNEEVDSLFVRAGIAGVVQQVGPMEGRTIEVGERVGPGSVLVEIVEPSKLMARVRIAETQAKDVVIGQSATIDTRNGLIQGNVGRVDPSVVNGTVTVDVHLTSELPKGARPDLSIDGVIELERLPNVVYVGRPVNGQEETTVGVFKVMDGGFAQRVPVTFGRASVTTIEIVKGIEPGDEVVMSDMSSYEEFDRVKLQ
ncbi:MAG: HlyD family efflux transporter periplasmic adaptor subunit [Verrucomicrobiales bacterium]|jgi:HlyD family secretion protein|nr:HlyD family efflux transporter periplasmic adaptor subunit [Verrucomicrobiales bacterium]MDF1784367.1 HlyD family efflux transporter periplasmic adaptor subunit [Verrucomicrobiales bacterium]